MNSQIEEILAGGGKPRIDRRTGTQTIYQGLGKPANAAWKGAKEWEVTSGNNRLRILSKKQSNGKTKFGFSNDHYDRIFDVIENIK